MAVSGRRLHRKQRGHGLGRAAQYARFRGGRRGMLTGTDMLVVWDLAILGLDVIIAAVIADLKYLTGKHISLPLARAYFSGNSAEEPDKSQRPPRARRSGTHASPSIRTLLRFSARRRAVMLTTIDAPAPSSDTGAAVYCLLI